MDPGLRRDDISKHMSSKTNTECIGKSEDFKEGKGKKVIIGFEDCAVFRKNGKLGCVTSKCVHKGGPLCDGWMKGDKIVCPWHFWEFDFQTGKGDGDESQGSYKIWEEDGKVFVETEKMETPRKEYSPFGG
ncbi:MAG: hypothetical protein CMI52_01300 [Parcubacteria group bacterium]|nr:hypothetical protein [Parcubacteria group bacterium]